METQYETESAPMSTLLKGIVHDAQDLLRQQLTLFQVEFRNDAKRTARAAIPLAIGVVICLIACLTLAITAAQCIAWVWPQMPLWGAYGIVTAALLGIGVACVLVGKTRFETFNPLPDQAIQGLKETVQWKTKP